MDKQSGIGCLATIVIALGLFFGALAFRGPTQDRILVCGAVLAGIGIIYTFVQLHLAPTRFFRAHILPSLVKSLKPLGPTRQDLADCLERCKTLGLKIGKVAKVDELWGALERQMAGLTG